jgi:putative glutamine amidotransferase
VEASRFGATALPSDLLDPRRDALTMALVPAAIGAGTPLFGVCRGLQEMNVALGGSLHQQVHAEPGLMDHREPEDEDLAVQFATRHEVRLAPGSAFAQWAGGTTAQVNSLHGQGIKRLGQGLAAEAVAPDGLIEGVRVEHAPAFAFGVQWHPEWLHESNPFYARSLEAFARACVEHSRRKPG